MSLRIIFLKYYVVINIVAIAVMRKTKQILTGHHHRVVALIVVEIVWARLKVALFRVLYEHMDSFITFFVVHAVEIIIMKIKKIRQ